MLPNEGYDISSRYAPVPVNWVPVGLGTQSDWVPSPTGYQSDWGYPV